MTITYDQPELWTDEARATVELAAYIVGARLSKYTGLDAAASFDAVFGDMYVRFTSTLTTHALALWGGIRFQRKEVITLPLVIHELGHIFSVKAKNRPTKRLWLDRNLLGTKASDWPGMHPPSIAKYNVVEQFCNFWEVRMLELYAQSAAGITPAGRALAAWMDAGMAEWVQIARER